VTFDVTNTGGSGGFITFNHIVEPVIATVPEDATLHGCSSQDDPPAAGSCVVHLAGPVGGGVVDGPPPQLSPGESTTVVYDLNQIFKTTALAADVRIYVDGNELRR
jgi:hypothetical protein